jgi:CheY-like chemotaxis protein
MPQGGRLVIETANVEWGEGESPHAFPAPPGRYVRLSVRDTGTGIDAETQAHIFEPFFTTKERGKGTGLGLATVYGIVKQHGGYIAVESEPGRGTSFRIYLPRIAGAAEPVEARLDPVVPSGGSETVLVVEDEAGPRDVARETLERYGYRVLEAGHPDEALQLLAQHGDPIHLMVADVVMPRMSGPELAERLRSLRPAMKVLYISGYTDNPALQGILDAGTPFLRKPFTPGALAGKVRQVLDPPGRDEAPMPAPSPTAP